MGAPKRITEQVKILADADKSELVDELLVAEFVEAEDFEGKHGSTRKLTLDLVVVTGDYAGQREDDFVAFGKLAKSIEAAMEVGDTAAFKLASGNNNSFKANFIISDAEFKKATAAWKKLAGSKASSDDGEAPF